MKIIDEFLACGTCVDACPLEAIVELGGPYKIHDDCTDCDACVDSCLVNAIVS